MKASVELIREKFAFTARRAYGLLLLAVSSYRYQPRHKYDMLRKRLVSWPGRSPLWLSSFACAVRASRGAVNHKRVHRCIAALAWHCAARSGSTASAEQAARRIHGRQLGVGRWTSYMMG